MKPQEWRDARNTYRVCPNGTELCSNGGSEPNWGRCTACFLADKRSPVPSDEKKEELLGVLQEANQAGGTKHDSGKPQLSLVSLELLEGLARVRAFGSIKYGKNNYRKGFKYSRSIDAALRHIHAFNNGEDLDKESGLSHIFHAVASLEHLIYDLTHHPENDDR